jgi:hypothetical protein
MPQLVKTKRQANFNDFKRFGGRIRVPPGGHFFTCITLFNGRVPPEVIGDYCDR